MIDDDKVLDKLEKKGVNVQSRRNTQDRRCRDALLVKKQMVKDEDLKKFIDETKTGRKKKTPEERRGEYDETKCDARIWKNAGKGMGYDNIQCNSKKVGGGCFCKKHQTAHDNGGWWLGKIIEPRPEKPFGPPGSKNPRIHVWNTDAEGKPVEKPSRKK